MNKNENWDLIKINKYTPTHTHTHTHTQYKKTKIFLKNEMTALPHYTDIQRLFFRTHVNNTCKSRQQYGGAVLKNFFTSQENKLATLISETMWKLVSLVTTLIFETTLKIVSSLTALATLLFETTCKIITGYTDYTDIQDCVKNAHHWLHWLPSSTDNNYIYRYFL